MADEKKKPKTLSLPIGDLHSRKLDAIIAYEKLTKPTYGKTDLMRDVIDERFEKLPEAFRKTE